MSSGRGRGEEGVQPGQHDHVEVGWAKKVPPPDRPAPNHPLSDPNLLGPLDGGTTAAGDFVARVPSKCSRRRVGADVSGWSGGTRADGGRQTMAARKVLIGFAVLALAVDLLARVANAFPPCGPKACSDEAAASGLTDDAGRACLKSLIFDCHAGLCSCTGGSPPCSCVCGDGLCGPSEDCSTCPGDCGPCLPTTTTTTTVPCQFNGSFCFGSCGGSETCVLVDTILRTCGCAASPTCQSSAYPTCGGNCPSGSVCQAVRVGASTGCRCVVGTSTCASGTGSACTQGCQIETVCGTGRCPPGEVCLAVFFGDPNPVCGCVPP